MIGSGGKQWFSAAELADMALPGLPRVKRKVNERAEAERWALKVDSDGKALARPRGGRGGGLEYHLSLLPPATRMELAARGLSGEATVTADLTDRPASRWPWYEAQTDKTRAEAKRRLTVVSAIGAFERGGLSRSAAVTAAAAAHGVSGSTLWSWLQLIDGIDPNDWLPHLAPCRKGGGAVAEIEDVAWQVLLSDYLRPEAPTFASCYWRLKRDYADPRGMKLPCERTLFRKIERLDQRLVIARRAGGDALRATLPPQVRSVAMLHAMELVNIDGHRWDVFVRFPDGEVRRPVMIAIQDVMSRRFLSWRIGFSEDAVMTRLVFADLFKTWGIPKGCLLDNGRAFASKWITGGAKTRFRFRIREEEPLGILTQLGIQTHWALPFRGSSKPIERGFRDFCDAIAKHPAFAGAYTGNKPDAKPENYGDRAVAYDDFIRVVTASIGAHNEKPGRRTEMAQGKFSFDDVFRASYAAAPIGKATPEQLRLALLTAEDRPTDRKSGAIDLAGNRYWAPELAQIAGTKVTVRFDPDDLTQPLHVYSRDGRYLVSAELLEATGFLDMAAAKTRARQESDLRKAVRRAAELEQLLDAEQLAALLPVQVDEMPVTEPSIIRPVRRRGQTAAALKPALDAAPALTTHIDTFAAGISRLRLVD
ncbi:transposase domain-containing protein [Sphingomonas naphthae]|uniref:Transposase domain-containing protein n=1 Tax=Sphingomonas naphthae TaxID=1813468 RepID=A0ABY7TFZ4_9SPHN|nr:transposase domain-containing protein [Sphingomonas naphthae]WCT72080.1 transposase domain-containing protein [Sphingomonas naphthae]